MHRFRTSSKRKESQKLLNRKNRASSWVCASKLIVNKTQIRTAPKALLHYFSCSRASTEHVAIHLPRPRTCQSLPLVLLNPWAGFHEACRQRKEFCSQPYWKDSRPRNNNSLIATVQTKWYNCRTQIHSKYNHRSYHHQRRHSFRKRIVEP